MKHTAYVLALSPILFLLSSFFVPDSFSLLKITSHAAQVLGDLQPLDAHRTVSLAPR
jgi:hypothetical protein